MWPQGVSSRSFMDVVRWRLCGSDLFVQIPTFAHFPALRPKLHVLHAFDRLCNSCVITYCLSLSSNITTHLFCLFLKPGLSLDPALNGPCFFCFPIFTCVLYTSASVCITEHGPGGNSAGKLRSSGARDKYTK